MLQYSGLTKKRILVVEDVELNQYLARHIMESWGCEVEIVENGQLAVDRIQESDYDLVLMDIQMPVMDGMEATKMIRSMQDELKSTVPIVALTANAQKKDCDAYLQLGMNDCLAKPFEEPALYKTVTKNIKQGMVTETAPAASEIKPITKVVEEEKLYNLAMVEAISGGDQSFIKRMLNLFLETVPATLHDIRSSADKGEWMALSKHAHKLKSTIDSMGIATLKQDIRAIEAGGKTGKDPEGLLVLVDRVIMVMQQVMGQVRARQTADGRRES